MKMCKNSTLLTVEARSYRNIVAGLILVIMVMVGSWILVVTSTSDYNKHACAATGYESDCKTPLRR